MLFLIGSATFLLLKPSNNQKDLLQASKIADIPFPGIQRISVQEAKAAVEKNKAVFVDVRGEELYLDEHIPGAISLPEDQLANRFSELNQDDWIITYCT